MKKSPVVFITNEVSKSNYSSAKVFGEIRVLSGRVYSFTPGSPANEVLAADIKAAADSFNEDSDYVLPSGSALSTSLFLIALFSRGIRKIRMLLWSGNDQSYHPGLLDLNVALTAVIK